MSTVNEKMTAIADRIRSYTGDTEPLTLDEMPSAIEDGASKAYIDGVRYGEGIGIKDGKQAQYDEFWDAYQDGGNRRIYDGAFYGEGWNDTTFKPKYPIVSTKGYRAFFQSKVTDISSEKVAMDWTGCTEFNATFYGCLNLKKVGVISTVSCSSLHQLFEYCMKLETVEKIVLKNDGSQDIKTNCFAYCNELQNITFEGKIGVSVTFSACSKLTHESLTSIINALKDYSGTTSTRTLTLHTTAIGRLLDTDIATIYSKGWSLVDNKGNTIT